MRLRDGKGLAQVMWFSEEETHTSTSLLSPQTRKQEQGVKPAAVLGCKAGQRRVGPGCGGVHLALPGLQHPHLSP